MKRVPLCSRMALMALILIGATGARAAEDFSDPQFIWLIRNDTDAAALAEASTLQSDLEQLLASPGRSLLLTGVQ